MIRSLQWIVTIGRLNIHTAVMIGLRIAPRIGHLERLRRIYGYLSKMRFASICVRTEEPDYSDIPDHQYDWTYTVYGNTNSYLSKMRFASSHVRTEEPDYSDIPDHQYDWTYSVYGNIKEVLPKDAPKPLGKHVTLSHYIHANLIHDGTTGKSVTGILHLVNKTPLDWYSKKQPTVETATYGSEFLVAAHICVEQIIDLRSTLRYLRVPVREKNYMFGNSKSVVNSSMGLHARLHKRHTTMLSFDRVREASHCVRNSRILFYSWETQYCRYIRQALGIHPN
jgi:hypothetical protein